MAELSSRSVEGVTMNTMKFENMFYIFPALFVSGSFVVSICIAIIAVIIIVLSGMV
jgi:hypothetical protein